MMSSNQLSHPHPLPAHDFDHLNLPGPPSAISAFDEQKAEENDNKNNKDTSTTVISDLEDINNNDNDHDNDNGHSKSTIVVTPCNNEISMDPDLLMYTSYYEPLGLSLVLYPLYLRIDQLQGEIADQSMIVNDSAQIQSLQQQLVALEQTYRHDGIWNGNLKLDIIPAGQAVINNLYERTHDICNEIIQRVESQNQKRPNRV